MIAPTTYDAADFMTQVQEDVPRPFGVSRSQSEAVVDLVVPLTVQWCANLPHHVGLYADDRKRKLGGRGLRKMKKHPVVERCQKRVMQQISYSSVGLSWFVWQFLIIPFITRLIWNVIDRFAKSPNEFNEVCTAFGYSTEATW